MYTRSLFNDGLTLILLIAIILVFFLYVTAPNLRVGFLLKVELKSEMIEKRYL